MFLISPKHLKDHVDTISYIHILPLQWACPASFSGSHIGLQSEHFWSTCLLLTLQGSRRTKSANPQALSIASAWTDSHGSTALVWSRLRRGKNFNPAPRLQRPLNPHSADQLLLLLLHPGSPNSAVEAEKLESPPCRRLISGWSRGSWGLRRTFFRWTTFCCPTRSSRYAQRPPCLDSAFSSPSGAGGQTDNTIPQVIFPRGLSPEKAATHGSRAAPWDL